MDFRARVWQHGLVNAGLVAGGPGGVNYFDEQPSTVTRAPGVGERTDEILAELGYDWDRIVELKVA